MRRRTGWLFVAAVCAMAALVAANVITAVATNAATNVTGTWPGIQMIREHPFRWLLGAAVALTVVSVVAWRLQGLIDSQPENKSVSPPATKPTEEDPFHLGVHRAIEVSTSDDLAVLPRYVPRQHDLQLREILSKAGRPKLIVLTGDSATGKTRSAWEAVQACLPRWRIVHPLDGAQLAALLTDGIPPQTAVWLDEFQRYLLHEDAVRLMRTLLKHDLEFVLLGTMWRSHWEDITQSRSTGIDGNGYAADLLRIATRIHVPASFENDQGAITNLRRSVDDDPRLKVALATAGTKLQVIQVLAGGRELVETYEHGEDIAVHAMLGAAMDLSKLGYQGPISPALLRELTADMLSAQERVRDETWFEDTVRLACAIRTGVRPLTPVRTAANVGAADGYVLHDYLGEYGRRARGAMTLAAAAWHAINIHVENVEQRVSIASEASQRSLLRTAHMLAVGPARSGSTRAMNLLGALEEHAGCFEAAEQWWRQSSKSGDLTGRRCLTRALERSGRRFEAMKLWLPDARNGEAAAMEELARLTEGMELVGQAITWWRRAAEAGSSVGQVRLALHVWKHDPNEARRRLVRATEDGDPIAMHYLVVLLREHDIDAALAVLAGAGDRGNLAALEDQAQLLGFIGRRKEAHAIMQRAAAAGSTRAMLALAEEHSDAGRGREAEAWLRKAMRHGEASAVARMMLILRSEGREAEITGLEGEALAAGDFHTVVQIALHREHYDPVRAGDAIRQAAEAGVPPAMRLMAERAQREGSNADAEAWWRRAIEAGRRLSLDPLAAIVERQGRGAEASRIRLFGLEPGGATSEGW